MRCLAESLIKTLLSQEILVSSVGNLKLNSKFRQKFNGFPGKYFFQNKLVYVLNSIKTLLPQTSDQT